jgi:hypothetical protein
MLIGQNNSSQCDLQESTVLAYAVTDINLMDEMMVDEILALDFEAIKLRLTAKHGNKIWPKEKCDATELQYKQFLALKRSYPQVYISPSKEVDQFWFEHNLDSNTYAADCRNIFGYYLTPSQFFGVNRIILETTFKKTLQKSRHLNSKYFQDINLGLKRPF